MGQHLSDLTFGTDSTLEVATWNIEHFPKNGQTTLDSVGKAIESLEIDVIGFQEIDGKNFFEQMVNDLDGWEVYVEPNPYSNLAYVYNPVEISVTSIYEIYTSSQYWRAFPRAPLVMEMRFRNEEFVLINNHLKCCGDGVIDANDAWDEETRRREAMQLLKQYIDNNFPNRNVILMGDLNDILTDPTSQNVFNGILNDPTHYEFADMAVANGPSNGWSFPNWPSHLDHLLISDELFDEFGQPGSFARTIKISNFLPGGFWEYDMDISDHYPVALLLESSSYGVSREAPIEQTWQVGPNPSRTSFRFTFPPESSVGSMGLFNSAGQLMHQVDIEPGSTSFTWEAAPLPAGIYFAKWMDTRLELPVKKLVLLN